MKNSVTISFVITDVLFKVVVAVFKLPNNFERDAETFVEVAFVFEVDVAAFLAVAEVVLVVVDFLDEVVVVLCFAAAYC